jgi:thioredoxin reductase
MTARKHTALLVVGGGPAGLAAAYEARRAGLEVTLVEQRSRLHGPSKLVTNVQSSGAELCLATAAWGIWSHEVAVCGVRDLVGSTSQVLVFDRLVLATGAYERPIAFPGWTLPGVMSAGGALALLAQGVSAGQQVVVAGLGVAARSTAEALRMGGVSVVDVVDADARIGRMVVRAEGAADLDRVVIARLDAEGCPRSGSEQTLACDALVLAFGHLPENQLARLAGCQLADGEYVSPRLLRDRWMRSSVAAIAVAGDAGGIVGPDAAVEQGRLAGLGAALDAGALLESEAEVRARPFRRRLQAATSTPVEPRPRPGMYALADASTIVCRCEDVTAGQIADRLFTGSHDLGPVIAESRAGMGSCQGRNCATQIAAVVSQRTGQPLERMPPITPRPPVVLVPIGAIAERPPVFEPIPGMV